MTHFIDDDQIASIVSFHGVKLYKILQRCRNHALLCVQAKDGNLSVFRVNAIPDGQASLIAQAFVAKMEAMRRIFARNKQLLIPECHLGLFEAGYLITARPLLLKSLFQRIRYAQAARFSSLLLHVGRRVICLLQAGTGWHIKFFRGPKQYTSVTATMEI